MDPEPELGVLGGRAGSLKIQVDLPYHPKKNCSQKYTAIPEIFSVDVIPLLLVGDIPLLGGNNIKSSFNKKSSQQSVDVIPLLRVNVRPVVVIPLFGKFGLFKLFET